MECRLGVRVCNFKLQLIPHTTAKNKELNQDKIKSKDHIAIVIDSTLHTSVQWPYAMCGMCLRRMGQTNDTRRLVFDA